MVTPPTAPILEVFDMADGEDDEEIDITYVVRAVTFLKYKGKGLNPTEQAQDGKECEIILDSGADASTVPESFQHLGEELHETAAPPPDGRPTEPDRNQRREAVRVHAGGRDRPALPHT